MTRCGLSDSLVSTHRLLGQGVTKGEQKAWVSFAQQLLAVRSGVHPCILGLGSSSVSGTLAGATSEHWYKN